MNRKTFIEAAKILDMHDDCYISFETKKHFIELNTDWEDGHPVWDEYDLHYTAFTADGKCYTDDEITIAIARKAVFLEQSTGDGWLFYISRNCPEDVIGDAFESSLGWLIECKQELCEMPKECADALNAIGFDVEATLEEETDEQEAEQEAEQAEQTEQEATEQAEQADEQEAAHHTIYDACTPAWAPTFAYDISHARTEAEQKAIIERATDAPAAETAEDETWFCGDATAPTDPDTAVQESDAAALTRTAEEALYHQRAAQQAAERAKRRGPLAFILTLIILIVCLTGVSTLAHALNKTAPALTTADAPAITGAEIMATRIDKKQTTTTPATQAPATATAPAETPTATATTPATTPEQPTLAQLLAKALEAQKTAQTAPQTAPQTPAAKESISLKTALKRALMAPKTGTTECVIYSTLYAAIRIEEVTTPAPTEATETPTEEAPAENKSAWTIQTDARRIAFMRELKNVSRGRAYCEQITAMLNAIDAGDDDYLWKTPAFTGLPEDLQKMLEAKFEDKATTEDEREECRAALDPNSERVTLHRAAIETACETLARTAPEWSPILYEEQPAPATLRQAILELQYCIFPIDSSPRARVFRGLEGIDFKTLSTPQDYQTACKAASLRAGEPSTAIPPEARTRIIQWRSGTVATSATTTTSTAARLAAVWGMD